MKLIQNYINRCLFVGTVFLLLTQVCFSQSQPATLPQNPVYEGSISGKVRDSVYKNLLNNATVTVYRQIDSTLLKFVIPDRLGAFQISALPLQTPLKLTITHVGYTPFTHNFELNAEKKSTDLGWISLLTSDGSNQIEEVSIMAYTPVKMNGDTIEFNPRAFKLEANATTEDLMRVLPGIVIWGDGDITFNGKKIQSLLVDGKPFIGGGDMSIATQNLPKEVIDKVQIYNQRNDINPLDSTLHANLKLLDTKKVGYFGKLGAGYGTDNRYAVDAVLNAYSSKFQGSAIIARNNINKTAKDITTLIKSGSFQGGANAADYHSDFAQAGINIATMAGTQLSYNFAPKDAVDLQNRSAFDYFFKDNVEQIIRENRIQTQLKADSVLLSTDRSNSTRNSVTNIVDANHVFSNRFHNLELNAVNSRVKNNFTLEDNRALTLMSLPISTSSLVNLENDFINKLNLGFKYSFSDAAGNSRENARLRKNLLDQVNVSYDFIKEDQNTAGSAQSTFISLLGNGDSYFNRSYESDKILNTHHLELNYPKLRTLLFGGNSLGRIDIGLKYRVEKQNGEIETSVYDVNPVSQNRQLNSQLTDERIEEKQLITYGLNIAKRWDQFLTNRYFKTIGLSVKPSIESYSLTNRANQLFRNIAFSNHYFVPNAIIDYRNHQYGQFELRSNIGYQNKINYATVDQLVPLVDSANLSYINFGNSALMPEKSKLFTASFIVESRTSKNPIALDLNVAANFTNDKISDSVYYDGLGRPNIYLVNLNRYQSWEYKGLIRKSYSPNAKHTFRIDLSYTGANFTMPFYLEGSRVQTLNKIDNIETKLNYGRSALLDLDLVFGVRYNSLSQSQFELKGQRSYSKLNATLKFKNKWFIYNGIDFNSDKIGNSKAIHYTIWNAHLTYRLLQGNKAEIKLSALDILNNNINVTNQVLGNNQTFGTSNVLRQYFMLSMSYFPRKFGE